MKMKRISRKRPTQLLIELDPALKEQIRKRAADLDLNIRQYITTISRADIRNGTKVA